MGKAVAAIVCASATSAVGRLKLFFAFLATTRFPFATCSQSKSIWYPYTNSIIHNYFWGYFRVFELTNLKNNHTSKHHEIIRDYLLLVLFNSAVNEYVFPGTGGTGGTGNIIEHRKQIAKVAQESRVSFTIHDLRRTFITVAESLDIPAYALKRLASHKMGNDVTAGYIISDVERLREPMQKITGHFLRSAGIGPSAEVIELFKKSPDQSA